MSSGNIPDIKAVKKLGIEDFVDHRSLMFFEILQLDARFLNVDPEDWHQNEAFLEAKTIASQLKTTNDIAERAVYLMRLVNQTVTHDWTQYEKLCINFYGKDL